MNNCYPRNIIIHIGYHKCASTYIQMLFLHSNVDFSLIKGGALRNLRAKKMSKEFMQNWIKKHLKKKNNRPKVLSQEALCGDFLGHSKEIPLTTAKNLKDVFPDARILILIRNQKDYIVSIYCYFVTIMGLETRNLRDFCTAICNKSLSQKLQYNLLIEKYINLFHRENILILPIEMLKIDNEIFFDKLSQFIHSNFFIYSNENKKFNATTRSLVLLQLCRALNILFLVIVWHPFLKHCKRKNREFIKSKFFLIKRLLIQFHSSIFKSSKTISPPSILSEFVDNNFIESNKQLSSMIKLDLKKYNYPLGCKEPL